MITREYDCDFFLNIEKTYKIDEKSINRLDQIVGVNFRFDKFNDDDTPEGIIDYVIAVIEMYGYDCPHDIIEDHLMWKYD